MDARQSTLTFVLALMALICAFLLAIPDIAYPQNDQLTIWLLPNELPLKSMPTPDVQELFVRDLPTYLRSVHGEDLRSSSNVHVRSVPSSLEQDSILAKRVYGQKQIFKELDAFATETGFNGDIFVEFFEWNQYLSVLSTAMEGMHPPDVIQVPSTWLVSLASEGVLLCLPDTVVAEVDSKYQQSALETCRIEGGNLFGLPWFVDLRLLYFRKTLSPYLESSLQDKESFRKSLRGAYEKTGKAPFALPTASDWELMHQTALCIWGFGGRVIKEGSLFRSARAEFDNDAGLAAIAYLLDLANAGYLDLPRVDRYALEEDFLNGKYTFFLCGPWLLHRAYRLDGPGWTDTVGVCLPPFNSGPGKVTFLGGNHLSVTTDCLTRRGSDYAIRLVAFLTQGNSSLRYAMETGYPPSSLDALGNAADALADGELLRTKQKPVGTYMEYLVSNTRSNDVVTVVEDALRVGRCYPPLADWAGKVEVPAIRVGLYDLWQHMAAGLSARTINADVKRFNASVNSRLADSRWLWAALFIGGLVMSASGIFYGFRRRHYRGLLTDLQARIRSVTDEKDRFLREKHRVEGEREEYRNLLTQLRSQRDVEAEEKKKRVAELKEKIQHKGREIRELTKHLEEHNRRISDLEDRKEGMRFIDVRPATFRISVVDETYWDKMNHSELIKIAEVAEVSWQEYKAEAPDHQYVGKLGRLAYRRGGAFEEKVKNQVEKLKDIHDHVLITGETGTGKGLVAEAIHGLRERQGRFEVVEGTQLDKNLARAELFGSCTGAFTGAVEKAGAFEFANEGTAFLDEIGDVPLEVQGILNRALDVRKFKRVGGRRHGKRDKRVAGIDHSLELPLRTDFIAATLVDLDAATKAGQFRIDLYERLNQHRIDIPPLRKRREDLPILLRHFLSTMVSEYNRPGPPKLSEDLVKALICYHWPRNVRQLENFVRRLYSLGQPSIRLCDIESFEDIGPSIRGAYELVFVFPNVEKESKKLLSCLEPCMDLLMEVILPPGANVEFALVEARRKCNDSVVSDWLDGELEGDQPGLELIKRRVLTAIFTRMRDALESRQFSRRKTRLSLGLAKGFLGVSESTLREWQSSEQLKKYLAYIHKSAPFNGQ